MEREKTLDAINMELCLAIFLSSLCHSIFGFIFRLYKKEKQKQLMHLHIKIHNNRPFDQPIFKIPLPLELNDTIALALLCLLLNLIEKKKTEVRIFKP